MCAQIGSSSALDVALGEKIVVLMVSVFLNTWYGAIMIFRSRVEDVCIGQYGFADLPKPLGNDGPVPEGGNSLLHITVIVTIMFSGNQFSCEAVSMLPLIQEARWFPCSGQLTARKLILGNCEQALLSTSSNLIGLTHGARQSDEGFRSQQFLH